MSGSRSRRAALVGPNVRNAVAAQKATGVDNRRGADVTFVDRDAAGADFDRASGLVAAADGLQNPADRQRLLPVAAERGSPVLLPLVYGWYGLRDRL